jgi:hypothetical protein
MNIDTGERRCRARPGGAGTRRLGRPARCGSSRASEAADEAQNSYQRTGQDETGGERRIPGGHAGLRPLPGRQLGLHGRGFRFEYFGVVPVARPVAADQPARHDAALPDDVGREGQHADRSGYQPALRLHHRGDPEPVHTGHGRGGRPERRGRRPHRGHPTAGRRLAGRHLGPVAGHPVRAGPRFRAARQGRDGRPRPDRQHRPGPALGPVVRGVHRGPVPQLGAGRLGDRRRAEPGRDGPGQAPGRVQPGDQPQHPGRRRGGEPARAERDLPARLPGLHRAGQSRAR